MVTAIFSRIRPMATIVLSPFFLLFCATSGVGAYLAHRLFVLRAKPGTGDRCLAIIAALQSLSLSLATYQIRTGCYSTARIDGTAAAIVAGMTSLGIAFICIECVLAGSEATE